MKPSMVPALVFAIILSGCAGGNPVSTPTVPSQQPTQAATKSTGGLKIQMAMIGTETVNQPVTLVVRVSPSANATLDFGDGTQVDFVLDNGVNVTLNHTYTRSGTFVATFTATDAAGESASFPITIVVS